MTWNDYTVTFATASPEAREGKITRCIRATSVSDAKWRVVRKFILPADATIILVERV